MKIVASVLKKGVNLGVLSGFLGQSLSAAPVPLPDWVKPIESSLPKLPADVISEVDEIITFMERYAEDLNFYEPNIKSQWKSYSLRFVNLQEQADQAMIWQYLKATGGQYTWALGRLGRDRDLAVWLLPVVRFRVEWLKIALRDPGQRRYVERALNGNEIYDIEDYFFKQGEFSDIENFTLLVDEAIKQNFKINPTLTSLSSFRERLQSQVKAMQEARNRSEQQAGPYWLSSASRLITEGVITADADALKPRPTPQSPGAASNRPKPLGPREPLPEVKPISDYPEPWEVWQIWLFLIAVSAILLRWLFRKPKDISGHEKPNSPEKKKE